MLNAPTSLDFVDHLISERDQKIAMIARLAEFMASQGALSALHYFEEAKRKENDGRYGMANRPDFDVSKATKALDAELWNKSIDAIGVRDFFPAARREEWNKDIREYTFPEFTDETARATLRNLLNQRMDFLAEMVDGIFRGLSREHVTNRPEGFTKRFILPYLNPDSFYYGDIDKLHDLRGVIAKFMSWPVPEHGSTRTMIEHMRYCTGEWFAMDAATLKVRIYKKGTGHIEVHPSIARRLNQVLAHLYPHAIPSQFREVVKNKKAAKEPELFDNPIPPVVLAALRNTRITSRTVELCRGASLDKHVAQRAADILEALGGVKTESYKWEFDYLPREALTHVTVSGVLPDERSHQYYPTPEALAKRAVELAQATEQDACVEPSAGQGAIAQYMPKGTVCMDISPLHVEILRSKGLVAQQGDCLDMTWRADVVVMNPPYSQKRWKTHTEHMLSMLNPGGRLVAILPTTAINGISAPAGVAMAHVEEHKRPFPGVSIDIAIIKWERAQV